MFLSHRIYIVLFLLIFNQSNLFAEETLITMHKQAGCMCCDKHARLLEEQGYTVELKSHKNLDVFKTQLEIPDEFVGCHTMLVDDYIVEGHVPGSMIKKLLLEKPDIKGIALPGMPIGTPGMPGKRDTLLDVYVIQEGKRQVYDQF